MVPVACPRSQSMRVSFTTDSKTWTYFHRWLSNLRSVDFLTCVEVSVFPFLIQTRHSTWCCIERDFKTPHILSLNITDICENGFYLGAATCQNHIETELYQNNWYCAAKLDDWHKEELKFTVNGDDCSSSEAKVGLTRILSRNLWPLMMHNEKWRFFLFAWTEILREYLCRSVVLVSKGKIHSDAVCDIGRSC